MRRLPVTSGHRHLFVVGDTMQGRWTVEIPMLQTVTVMATISPSSVKAGSDDNEITVEFTAAGTMDGGAVRLEIPDEWGSLQDDDATEANYVEIDVRGRGKATANVGPSAAIAYLEGVVKGSKVRFTYGGGTVRSRNGAQVQPTIAVEDPAAFMIESDGDGDGSFEARQGYNERRHRRMDDTEQNETSGRSLQRRIPTRQGRSASELR